MLDSYSPPASLKNPNLQTILSSVGRKVVQPRWLRGLEREAEERLIDVSGLKLLIRINRAKPLGSEAPPLVMIIPGWLGNLESTYVRSAAQVLSSSGFDVVRINLRDHGNTAHLNPGLFHSALIDEVIELTRYLMNDFGVTRAGLIGYSMGGNFALRVARVLPNLETLAICPALGPEDTMRTISASTIYEYYFVKKWRRLWRAKQAAFPEHYDFSATERLDTLAALTDYFVDEHTDYDCVEDYCAAYDLRGDTLAGVRARILAAEDDPIIPPRFYQNLPESIEVDVRPHGGHTAFLKNWRLESWADDYAKAFFQRLSQS